MLSYELKKFHSYIDPTSSRVLHHSEALPRVQCDLDDEPALPLMRVSGTASSLFGSRPHMVGFGQRRGHALMKLPPIDNLNQRKSYETSEKNDHKPSCRDTRCK